MSNNLVARRTKLTKQRASKLDGRSTIKCDLAPVYRKSSCQRNKTRRIVVTISNLIYDEQSDNYAILRQRNEHDVERKLILKEREDGRDGTIVACAA